MISSNLIFNQTVEINSQQLSLYKHSSFITKLKEQKRQSNQLKIAFLDIDVTMTGNPPMTNKVRQILEQTGYATVYVTSRTEELLMSESEYLKSVDFGLKRPHPRMGRKNGKRMYIPPESVEPIGSLNPDIIASSTGTRVLVHQLEGGYKIDHEFERKFRTNPKFWRANTLKVIDLINKNHPLVNISPIDIAEKYYQYQTDVFPPDYRVQVHLKNFDDKQEFLKRIKILKKDESIDDNLRMHLLNMTLIDDSNHVKKKYAFYITPLHGHKFRVIEVVVNQITQLLRVPRNNLTLLLAGDNYPDLEMGLFGGLQTNATFILVGGSHLGRDVIEHSVKRYTGMDLTPQESNSHSKHGFYELETPLLGKRKIIIGEEAYPDLKGPETIFSFLESHKILTKQAL